MIHGSNLAAYDHQMFPGPVPRTFLGALALSLASLPWRLLCGALALPKVYLQLAVRCTLAAGVCTSLAFFLRSVAARLGVDTAAALALALCAAPHYLYYASRTLPNTFALLLLARCAAHWVRAPRLRAWQQGSLLQRAVYAATAWEAPSLDLAAAVLYFCAAMLWFRCDLLAFLLPTGLAWMAGGRATLRQLLALGCACGAAAVAVTMALDTPLWGRCKANWLCFAGALWPELNVLLINVRTAEQEKYADQVHAWHWYFSSALPKSLLLAAPFVPLGLLSLGGAAAAPGSAQGRGLLNALAGALDWEVCELALPALAYPVLMSFNANKQLRFILPVYPLLFLAAGSGVVKTARLAQGLLFPTDASSSAAPGAASAKKKAASRRASLGGAGSSSSSSSSSSSVDHSATSLSSTPSPGVLSKLLGYSLLAGLGLCFALSSLLTGAFLYTNLHNYPGGRALQRLYTLVDADQARSAGAGKAAMSTLLRSQPSGQGAVLAPCLAGDVTGKQWGVEWSRQCLAGDCPSSASSSSSGRACATPSTLAPIRVHVSNLAAQTGVSRFGEPWSPAQWSISKAENLTVADFRDSAFDYILAESEGGGGGGL